MEEQIRRYLRCHLIYLVFLSVFVICSFYLVDSLQSELSGDVLLFTKSGVKYQTKGEECPFGSSFRRIDVPVMKCVCSNGLWAFFRSACGLPILIHGSEGMQCTDIDFKIKKSLLISETMEPSLTGISAKRGIVFRLFENSEEDFQFESSGVVIANEEWWLEYKDGKQVCVGREGFFCLYDAAFFDSAVVRFAEMGCRDSLDVTHIAPLYCTIPKAVTTKSPGCGSKRSKRYSDYAEMSSYGRAYIPSLLSMNEEFASEYAGNMTPPMNSLPGQANATIPLPPYDEDLEMISRIGNPIIKSEIWSYITDRVTRVMQLYSNDQPSTPSKIPAIKFLEISKEIIKKRCPLHYVPPDHYDLAVKVFRGIQLRDMLYTGPPITLIETERILKVLNLCLQNAKQAFPFVEMKRTCNNDTTNGSITDIPPLPGIESIGKINMFDQEIMIDVPNALSPMEREPLIETVWQIYFHAHSYCYPYFEKSRYNDHHKFSTTMMSLFTNGILELWTEITELMPDIYSGFLSDAVMLMQRVVHCAAVGRIQNHTTYPWDLVRPGPPNTGNYTIKSPKPAGGTPEPPAPASTGIDDLSQNSTRRKRKVPSGEMPYNLNRIDLECLRTIEQNSYVCKH